MATSTAACILPCLSWFVEREGPSDKQDEWQGLLPRWNINFNITMLRLVSFGMDYHWAKTGPTSTPTQPSSYRQRIATSHSLETYSFANYIAYALYPPLYIAGPIISFNDFTWQVGLMRLRLMLTLSFNIHYTCRVAPPSIMPCVSSLAFSPWKWYCTPCTLSLSKMRRPGLGIRQRS